MDGKEENKDGMDVRMLTPMDLLNYDWDERRIFGDVLKTYHFLAYICELFPTLRANRNCFGWCGHSWQEEKQSGSMLEPA